MATELRGIAASGLAPAEKLDAAVAAMGAFVETHAFFPSIMLREVAEGGAHLDPDTLAALAGVPQAFAALLLPGVETGAFRPLHPIAAYFTTIAPILMFVASTPVRKQLSSRRLVPAPESQLTLDLFLADLTRSLQRAFASPSHA